ncbi:MAG: hypothetical protein IM551_03240 [Chitinophagaceae bacterium]|nr:hypothetical protein [Chitinophagaceae bacterium]
MLQRFLFIALTLCSLTASAQWQQTGSKVRYVNGLGIPTKDTAAGVAADSSQILIRPADSSLYVKYKRTWLRVGGGAGGGSIGGSGTTNYVPKFTSSTAIGNSQIFDNGTSVGIGTASPSNKVDIFTTNRTALNTVGSGLNVNYNGSTTGQFATLGFSWNSSVGNNSTQWGMGMIGTNFVSGTADINFFTCGVERMRITCAGNVGIDYTAPASKLAVNGTALINTNTDNGVDRLQVSGSASVTSLFGVGTSPSAGTVHIKTTSPSIAIDDNDNAGTAAIRFRPQSASFATRGSIELISTGSAAPTRFVIASTDTMTFRTNSVERVRVTPGTGSVLISKTTDNGIDKLQVNGSIDAKGFAQAYTAKGATYTATTSDYLIDCTTGTFTVNLPDALLNVGRILIIKNSGTGTITVDGDGTQTIDGATTYSLSARWATVQIMCDGNNWKIIAKF